MLLITMCIVLALDNFVWKYIFQTVRSCPHSVLFCNPSQVMTQLCVDSICVGSGTPQSPTDDANQAPASLASIPLPSLAPGGDQGSSTVPLATVFIICTPTNHTVLQQGERIRHASNLGYIGDSRPEFLVILAVCSSCLYTFDH